MSGRDVIHARRRDVIRDRQDHAMNDLNRLRNAGLR